MKSIVFHVVFNVSFWFLLRFLYFAAVELLTYGTFAGLRLVIALGSP